MDGADGRDDDGGTKVGGRCRSETPLLPNTAAQHGTSLITQPGPA
jgi:hypothetical protein